MKFSFVIINKMADYVTRAELNTILNQVQGNITQVNSVSNQILQDNKIMKDRIAELLNGQQQLNATLASTTIRQNGNVGLDRGAIFYGSEQYQQGGQRGSQWSISNPASIMAFRASKAVVDPADFYDCKNKKLVDYYGRQVEQSTLPIWTCEGDDPNIAIQREDKVSRFAYDELEPYPVEIPYGLQI